MENREDVTLADNKIKIGLDLELICVTYLAWDNKWAACRRMTPQIGSTADNTALASATT